MSLAEFLVICAFIGVMLSFIVAGYLLNRTIWRYCPTCHHWHNEAGEWLSHPPAFGCIGNTSMCDYCHKGETCS